MSKAYERPPELAPDPALIKLYLRRAQPTGTGQGKGFEPGRVAANNSLLALYRDQSARGEVDPQLRLFFDQESRRIWTTADPVMAMTAFLGKPPRGAKPKYAYRDFLIAVEVAERMQKGQNRDETCLEVGVRAGLSPESVQNIYARRPKKAVQAELALRKYEGEASGA